MSAVPIYFETSWSIMSSIGLVNVLIGLLVVGITNLSPITIVPIVVAAANAISDGLCYYAFYANYPIIPTAIAAIFADFFWLVQEAGLSFYSYQILIRILRGRDRTIFISAYWTIIGMTTIIRLLICINRVLDILQSSVDRVDLIDHLHIGYFTSIALAEALSSFFLLRKFFSARRDSLQLNSKVGLFKYLTRSTEIRLGVLTIIGVTRAITYSFQTTTQSATAVSGQVDRFVATLECLFPIVMFIDILAAKSLVSDHHKQVTSSRGASGGDNSKCKRSHGTGTAQGVYSMNHIETRIDANAAFSSSQERIVGAGGVGRGAEFFDGDAEGKAGGINKTVEFVFHESDSPV